MVAMLPIASGYSKPLCSQIKPKFKAESAITTIARKARSMSATGLFNA